MSTVNSIASPSCLLSERQSPFVGDISQRLLTPLSFSTIKLFSSRPTGRLQVYHKFGLPWPPSRVFSTLSQELKRLLFSSPVPAPVTMHDTSVLNFLHARSRRYQRMLRFLLVVASEESVVTRRMSSKRSFWQRTTSSMKSIP